MLTSWRLSSDSVSSNSAVADKGVHSKAFPGRREGLI